MLAGARSCPCAPRREVIMKPKMMCEECGKWFPTRVTETVTPIHFVGMQKAPVMCPGARKKPQARKGFPKGT